MRNTWLRGSCIGRGAYGSVNAAVNTATGNIFAVKSVNLAMASPSQVEALESEIAILRSLSSPFIVKYLGDDTTSEGQSKFRNLHMEYLPAGTAADLSDRSEAAVASYAWCLVAALSYLHSRGIVHCDVKGKNVLLGHSPGIAALADFGSAVDVDVSAAAGRGSPLWMAPEVIRGERQGREADVWSVGCTVIEMLTGKPAWGGSVWRIGYSDEVPLFPAGISGAGADFLEKCLRRDYTRRWSCDQLLQHPFLMMGARKEVACHWSPRCVLDFLNSDFHEEEEMEEEEEGEMVDLEGSERISGLVSAVGGNWDSDGWVVVRGGGGGTCSDSSDLIEDTTTSLSINLDFDFQTCVNSNSNLEFNRCNVCTKTLERLYNCGSNYGFVYVHFHIIWNLIEFVLLNVCRRSGLEYLQLQRHFKSHGLKG
ncbi:mitogen-activated protein kinase kinase kinase 18-like [Salvia hispanica]|uniref:mitogen-activated protein kinase kinase kinase 18-like n=1 Tax=Salvia hispanica TaxID=49212 RepID=UPI0020094A42|nr:mitogen-activated protein kinase kinase kinase 18-like [Salvia hispanica]